MTDRSRPGHSGPNPTADGGDRPERDDARNPYQSDTRWVEKGAQGIADAHGGLDENDHAFAAAVLAAVLPEYRAQVIRECAEAVRRHADEREQRGGDGRLHAEGCDIAADLLDRIAGEAVTNLSNLSSQVRADPERAKRVDEHRQAIEDSLLAAEEESEDG